MGFIKFVYIYFTFSVQLRAVTVIEGVLLTALILSAPSQFRGTFVKQRTNRNVLKCASLQCALRGEPMNGKNVRLNVEKYV